RQDADALERELAKRRTTDDVARVRAAGGRAVTRVRHGHAGGVERVDDFEDAAVGAVLFANDDRAPRRETRRIAAREAGLNDGAYGAAREVDALDADIAVALLVARDDVRRSHRIRPEHHLVDVRAEAR